MDQIACRGEWEHQTLLQTTLKCRNQTLCGGREVGASLKIFIQWPVLHLQKHISTKKAKIRIWPQPEVGTGVAYHRTPGRLLIAASHLHTCSWNNSMLREFSGIIPNKKTVRLKQLPILSNSCAKSGAKMLPKNLCDV